MRQICLALVLIGAVHATAQFGASYYSPGLLNMHPWDMACGDIDNDGDEDLVFALESVINAYLNDGGGGFPDRVAIGTTSALTCIDLGDVDGDGDLDVVSGGLGDPTCNLNLGGGQFGPTVTIGNNIGTYQGDIKLADLDGDGDLDAICSTSNRTSWCVNDGNGTFSNQVTISSWSAFDMELTDLDGDGDLDILCAAPLENVFWFRQQADHTFGLPIFQANSQGPRTIEVADMDGDLDPDMVFEAAGMLQWRANDGSGTFTTADTVLIGETLVALDVADLDMDGDMDVLGAGADEWKWWRNDAGVLVLGPGPCPCVGMGTSPRVGAALDVNNDGDAELVLCDYYDHNAVVVDNVSVQPEDIHVNVRVGLGGPYVSSTQQMNDGLRDLGLIPLTEPYTALGYPFVQGGGEVIEPSVLADTGTAAIVDWVVVELRDTADPATVVYSRCGLMRRDARIVDLNGTSSLYFPLPPGGYHVAVRHRNHLGCMSAFPIPLANITTPVNFLFGQVPTWGTEGTQQVGTRRVLWAGDTQSDGSLIYAGGNNDSDPILQSIGGVVPTNVVNNVYDRRDVNLDGQVKYTGANNDRDPILVNIGGLVPTNTRTQQLP